MVTLLTAALFVLGIVLVATLVVNLALTLPGWRDRRDARRRSGR